MPRHWKELRNEYRTSNADDRVQWMQDHANALRQELRSDRGWSVARSCVSFRHDIDDVNALQTIAYDQWHDIIVNTDSSDTAVEGFRILCNCVTQNKETSRRLLTYVSASPTNDSDNHPNWVDLLLRHRSNRDCLAAVVACWYNASVMVRTTTTSCPLLLETLLRNAVNATTKIQDDATDWMRRAVSLYSRMHGLQESYESLGRNVIVPEHVVFLLLVLRSIEEEASPKPLSELGDSSTKIQGNLRFLVQLIIRDNQSSDAMERNLQRDVRHLAMEIISEALTVDCDSSYRQSLGRIPGVWEFLLTKLAFIVDHWNNSASGKKTRETPALSDDDQRFLTNCVRCIGNLTYQCAYNQDCLRTTRLSNERNGLHILLSTTGMAVSCFTVREWGIVAIRNALDQNPENQRIVERLQAEHAVQTTALEDMGLQINISSDGKASVTPKT